MNASPRQKSRAVRIGHRGVALAAGIFAFLAPLRASAASVSDVQKLLNTGKYEQAIAACSEAISGFEWDENFWLVKMDAEMATGKYADALKTFENSLQRNSESVRLRIASFDILRANNRPADAQRMLLAIRSLAVSDPYRYSDALSRVALGRALLLAGADAKQVLELFYDSAKKIDPASPQPLIASGQLALEKEDYAVAAEAFQAAAKLSPDDPNIYVGIAQSYPNDSDQINAALTKALELNPRHVEALLFQADNLIDQEAYEQAEALVKKVLEINPHNWKAWSYRAVMAHLAGDRKKEEASRKEALSAWATNPAVDNIIGQKLAQKYRFAEGVAYQRTSLKFDPNYRPAKMELCQALLRLGQEQEGWLLAAEVFKEDPYNVLAYNLITLRDNLKKFATLQNEHFLVRMDPREAQIYGQRVLSLLDEARKVLCEKYDVTIDYPITVEVFPQQKDFAIRTFGLPGGAGYLGVCFGPLITANSPASRGANPTSWEAILWHEYCHAVTLHKTNNKMPRWLSEGISVYEERRRNPGWGQTMDPTFRDMIKQGAATPVSKLSGAFLKPETAMHLQLAYFESSMVVQYIIDNYGLAALQWILNDLGKDVPINEALAKYTEPIDKLDADFDAWMKKQADNLAPKADLDRPEDIEPDADSATLAAFNKEHPNNFWTLLGEGRALIAEEKFEAAKAPLEKAIELFPNYGKPGGPYVLLASAYKALGNTTLERENLEKHIALAGDAVDARMRLIEIATQQKDWPAVKKYSEQVLGINPLFAAPHRSLLASAEALSERKPAIVAHRTLLVMDPLDRADHYYRLARLLMQENQLPEARRDVVMALEQAPRYQEAHHLLLEIVQKMGEQPVPPPAPAVQMPATAPAASVSP
jgi:tetratricopeptide (TPR) repeat protein